MAGHSHFKNIKRKKEAEDKKRGIVFSKFSRLIISSVREKGKDIKSNPSLKTIIEKAREADMPKENIEKAIKRGAGEGEKGHLEPFLFEIYTKENAAILVTGSTDNINRNSGEIKETLKRHDAKIATPGSVKWLFEKKGIIEIKRDRDNLLLSLIDFGIEDIEEKEDVFLAYLPVKDMEDVKEKLISNNIDIISTSVGFVPKNKIKVDNNNYINLIEALQENEDVEEIYTNIE